MKSVVTAFHVTDFLIKENVFSRSNSQVNKIKDSQR